MNKKYMSEWFFVLLVSAMFVKTNTGEAKEKKSNKSKPLAAYLFSSKYDTRHLMFNHESECSQPSSELVRLVDGRINRTLPIFIDGCRVALSSVKERIKDEAELRALFVDLGVSLATLGMGSGLSKAIELIPKKSHSTISVMKATAQALESSGIADKLADVPKKIVSKEIVEKLTPLYGQQDADLFIGELIKTYNLAIDATSQRLTALTKEELCDLWANVYDPHDKGPSWYANHASTLIEKFNNQVAIIGSKPSWINWLSTDKWDARAFWIKKDNKKILAIVETVEGRHCPPHDPLIGDGPCEPWQERYLKSEVDESMVPYVIEKMQKLYGNIDEIDGKETAKLKKATDY